MLFNPMGQYLADNTMYYSSNNALLCYQSKYRTRMSDSILSEQTEQQCHSSNPSNISGMISIIHQRDEVDQRSKPDPTQQVNLKSSQGKKKNILSHVFDPLRPNPQEKSEIDRQIEQIRSRRKKKNRAPFIRTCELGESQLTFTKAEEMGLQMIEEFLKKGFKVTDPPSSDVVSQESEFEEQIESFRKWGAFGNRNELSSLATSNIRQYLNEMKLPENEKVKKKKQLKSLNFQRRLQIAKICKTTNCRPCSRIIAKPGEKTAGGNSQISSTIDRPLNSQHSPYKLPTVRILKQNLIEEKPKRVNKHEKLHLLSQQLAVKYSVKPSSTYMTKSRYQALYDCEMIKGAKQILDSKDYTNLSFLRVSEMSGQEKSNALTEENESEFPSSMHLPDKEHELFKKSARGGQAVQIDKIIQKNRKRLRFEKLRVIEKLRF